MLLGLKASTSNIMKSGSGFPEPLVFTLAAYMDIPKSLFVLLEDKLRVDGQVQSANEVGQLFVVLNDTEQVDKVTVVVVQDQWQCL